MRHTFSFLIIAFSVSALLGGFFSGRAAMPRFTPRTPQPAQLPAPALPAQVQIDEVPNDDFAGDAAVASTAPNGDLRDDAQLAVVLVDVGRSAALAAPFLGLPIPITVVIDPLGVAAKGILSDAQRAGDGVYLQAQAPLSAYEVRTLFAQFPAASGIALRITDGSAVSKEALATLRRNGWALLDEYGESDATDGQLARTVARFASRSITVDDHAQPAYVAYMLRAAVRVARGRTAVVMARPFPGTLQAFEGLLAQASRDGVRFVKLR